MIYTHIPLHYLRFFVATERSDDLTCILSNFTVHYLRHGLCNAHLLRGLTAFIENTKQAWAQALIDLLLQMKSVKERLLSQSRHEPPPYYLKKFNIAYNKILAEALEHNPSPVRDPSQKGRMKRGKTGALVSSNASQRQNTCRSLLILACRLIIIKLNAIFACSK